jgi:hypothetical protein
LVTSTCSSAPGAPDRLAGGPIDVGQPVDAAAHQDRVDGAGGQADLVGDRDRPEALLPAQVHDLADQRLRGLAGLAVRT